MQMESGLISQLKIVKMCKQNIKGLKKIGQYVSSTCNNIISS